MGRGINLSDVAHSQFKIPDVGLDLSRLIPVAFEKLENLAP